MCVGVNVGVVVVHCVVVCVNVHIVMMWVNMWVASIYCCHDKRHVCLIMCYEYVIACVCILYSLFGSV